MATLFLPLLPEEGELGELQGVAGGVGSEAGEEADSSRETLLVTGQTRELGDWSDSKSL